MALRIDILTLFPEMFDAFRATSIVGRACQRGLIDIRLANIRDFALDKYGSVDDAPFGGGPGMVLMCQPLFDAVEHLRAERGLQGLQGSQEDLQESLPKSLPKGRVLLMTPQGRPLTQAIAAELARQDRLIIIAGHYEGFDERIRQGLADDEISIGDFVLSGGEIAAMALVDAVARLQPGALGKDESTHEESFSTGLLEYPQYTRPREFRGMQVPEVLLNGDHAKITAWRAEQARKRTRERRADLWEKYVKEHPDQEA
jgi:tRNA (guanine37-N1)-methyltransferase